MMANYFSAKYPIVACSMLYVSDIKLAIAIAKAGAVPSLTLSLYPNLLFDKEQFNKLNNDLRLFSEETNSADLIVSSDSDTFIDSNIADLLKSYGIKWCEIISGVKSITQLEKIKSHNLNIIGKLIGKPVNRDYIAISDGFIFKGSVGAGRIDPTLDLTLVQLTDYYLNNFPGKLLIPSGGVCSADQVDQLLSAGASAVGVGTLFAASLESPLVNAAKQQLINSGSSNLSTISTTDHPQSTLLLSLEVVNDKENNTQGFVKGIQTGKYGHIFASPSINSINLIKPAAEIIKTLCSNRL